MSAQAGGPHWQRVEGRPRLSEEVFFSDRLVMLLLSRVGKEEVVAPSCRRPSRAVVVDVQGCCDSEGHIAHGLRLLQWRLDEVRHWNAVGYYHKASPVNLLEIPRWGTLDLQDCSGGIEVAGVGILD